MTTTQGKKKVFVERRESGMMVMMIEILRKGENKSSEIDPARKVNMEYKGRIQIMSVKKEALDDAPKTRQNESDSVRISWSNSVENRAGMNCKTVIFINFLFFN